MFLLRGLLFINSRTTLLRKRCTLFNFLVLPLIPVVIFTKLAFSLVLR